jgi:hypothetical protein
VTAPQTPPSPQFGGRLAGKVAGAVADASLYAKQRASGHTAKLSQQILADFTNHVSDEVRSVLGNLWASFAQDPETPDEFRALFSALATQRGQAWAWIGGSIASAGVGGGLSGVFSVLLAPLVQATARAYPSSMLSPADAARAAVTGRTAGVNVDRDLASAGFDDNRTSVLKALAETTLSPEVVVDMLRRGVINDDDARTALRHAGLSDLANTRMRATRWLPLSPTEAAAAWARGSMSEQQSNTVGARSGVTGDDMRVLRDLAGEPPAIAETLLAWRRGVITEAQVDKAITQGPLRNEWIPVVKALQWEPLSPAEAADAVNQGHMSLAAAQAKARESGVKPEDFAIVVANAGIPPGPQEALDWVNRGLLSEAGFREAFLESRLKNKYIDLYLSSRHEVMPPETVRLMYSRGVMDRSDALSRLQQRGYSAQDAAIILNGASAEKTAKTRDLTVSQVLQLREHGLVSDAAVRQMLSAAGYDDEEAQWLFELAELRRVTRYVNAVVNRVKASYVAGRVDEVQAGATLDQLGLPASYKDDALALWDLERAALTKALTPAQVVAAVKAQLLTSQQGVERLQVQGYSAGDAAILLILGKAVAAT